jgi:hypothetical protein
MPKNPHMKRALTDQETTDLSSAIEFAIYHLSTHVISDEPFSLRARLIEMRELTEGIAIESITIRYSFDG